MKKNIFSWIVLMLFLIISVYISWINWWIQFVFSICIYGLIFFVLHIIWVNLKNLIRFFINKNSWKNINTQSTKSFLEFIQYFTHRISVFLLTLFSLFGLFIYYENYLEPALLPEFTISNWQKTVVFQWMAHIWSEKFYKTIQNNIKENKNKWYVLFFEGVKLSKKENMDKFDRLIWFEFNKKTYSNLSKLYWLSAQNNQDFLGLVNDKDYNTDVSMDVIIEKYEKKFWTITKDRIYNKLAKTPLKMDEIINQTVELMTPKELEMLIQINRALMNFIIKNENVRNSILATSGQWDLFGIILYDRNKVIVDAINKSGDNKIHILYGLMHFNWVWQSLQEEDPNWKLVNIRYFKPID